MKGVIVAAGYGTRFLPVTKTVPKEMLPIIDKPSVAFIIEEFISSGIEEIVIISSRRKKALEDYLDREIELETLFKAEGATAKLAKIEPYKARFYFVRQEEMLGTGHALLQVKGLIGNEPCVVAYPDDLHEGEVPLSKQLIELHAKTGCSVLATLHNPPELNRYGILDIDTDNLHVKGIVEKPPVGREPSREASIGRYLYTPEFFAFLEEGWADHLKRGTEKEYFHTYALGKLMERRQVVYKAIEGRRLDTGSPEGYLRAIVSYSLGIPELKAALMDEIALRGEKG